jgi:hypothetical protein
MSVNVVSFFRSAPRSRDWNNQELAEFYRVEASMIRSGLSVVTDRGLSDEGDPWFVFCNAETEDVIVHFARIDDLYVVASPAFNNCVRGRQFRPLIENLIESHPLVIARPKDGGKLFIHPAALLVALVTTCFFKLGQSEAVAAEARGTKVAPPAAGSAVATETRNGGEAVILDERAAHAVLTAIAIAVTWAHQAVVDTSFEALGVSANATDSAVVVGNSGLEAAEASGLESAFSAFPHALSTRATTIGSMTEEAGAQHALVFSATKSSSANLRVNLLQKAANSDLPTDATIAWVHNPHDGVGTAATTNLHLSVSAVINFPVSAASVEPASNAASSSSMLSAASQELLSLLGASAQSHIVATLSSEEQKLVAAITSSPSGVITQAAVSTTATTAAPATAQAPSSAQTATQSSDAAPSAPAASTMNAAGQAIMQFTAQHPDFEIAKMAKEVIIFDSHLTISNVSSAVQEIFTFQDGSSIFLIGLPATTMHG